MASAKDIVARIKRNPRGVSFKDLTEVCDQHFGEPRQSGTSHRVYKTPCRVIPRVNIQSARGMAKPYPVRQVLQAIHRLEVGND